MQIQILSKLKKKLSVYPELDDLELHLIGGVRNSEDEQILDELRQDSLKLCKKYPLY